jgi:hypothetical protein
VEVDGTNVYAAVVYGYANGTTDPATGIYGGTTTSCCTKLSGLPGNARPNALAVTHAGGTTMIWAGATDTGAGSGGIYKSTDGGATWQTSNLKLPVANRYIQNFAVAQRGSESIAVAATTAGAGAFLRRVQNGPDFDNDGNADILWFYPPTATTYVWEIKANSAPTIHAQGILPAVGSGWSVAGLGDFNGDGATDILWRHTNGTNYIWNLDGSAINGGVVTISSQGLLPSVDSTWTVAGIGDFNGDGKSDILWRKNDGTNYVWHVDASVLNGGMFSIASQGLLPGVDTTWSVAGIGDFNDDGKSDIFWRKNDGTNFVWHVDGAVIINGMLSISSAGLLPAVTDMSFNVAGIGDFNGDGKSDVLWRHTNGSNYVWNVNGAVITNGVLSITSQGLLPSVTAAGWSIQGVSDYNGDGKSDILWRNNSDGSNYIWQVDGLNVIPTCALGCTTGPLPVVPDLTWGVVNK